MAVPGRNPCHRAYSKITEILGLRANCYIPSPTKSPRSSLLGLVARDCGLWIRIDKILWMMSSSLMILPDRMSDYCRIRRAVAPDHPGRNVHHDHDDVRYWDRLGLHIRQRLVQALRQPAQWYLCLH